MGSVICCCCGFGAESAFPRKEGLGVKRAPTDIGCMVLFWLFIVGMGACVWDGYFNGNIARLTHGADWEGNLCGIDAAVADKPYMMYCGSPERVGDFPKFIIQGSTACVQTCPVAAKDIQIDCLMPAYHNFTTYKTGTIAAANGVSMVNVETLDMTLTQSVTTQWAYPTEPFGGRFCLPSKANPELRDLVLDGPWGHFYRPMVAIGGLRDAWPLFALSAGLASLMGLFYVWTLQKCAGVLIFGSMVFTTLLTLALGIFFFFAVIQDMDDNTTVYAKFNPIMSVFIGQEAKMYSVVTGVIIILLSVFMGALAATSLAHIDEMVGLIAAASEALNSGCTLQFYPFFQGAVFVVLFFIFFFIGFPMVMSLGSFNSADIVVNGESVNGLEVVFRRTWLQHKMVVFYAIGCVFLLEFYIQMGHYIVAYSTSRWYFTEGRDQDVDNNKVVAKALGGGAGKSLDVRVAGIDPNYGPRRGTVVETQAGKMLVVPVDKKGPGLNRLEMQTSTFIKPPVACGSTLTGLLSVLFYHVGALALGAPFIFFFRPFRLIGEFMHHFVHHTHEHEKHWNDHKPGHGHEESGIRSCISLMSHLIEDVFGPFSKNAYTELVLNGTTGFFKDAYASMHTIHHAGGTITQLHGKMMTFEMFGVFFITIFCAWAVLIVQDKVDAFNEPGPYYIEDKNASAIAATLIAFAVAYAWMSTWNQIADVLLYCVAWNRHQLHEGHVHKFEHSELIGNVKLYCPQHLRYLMPPSELEASDDHGHQAHGMGQAMQMMATMEHQAMKTFAGAGESFGGGSTMRGGGGSTMRGGH